MDKDVITGNYLVSARFTDAIYLISKRGKVIWRLGGEHSSFKQDFNFSHQHNARIRRSTKSHMLVSFLDNASDDKGEVPPSSESSSLMIVDLDLASMTATTTIQHRRPDGGCCRDS